MVKAICKCHAFIYSPAVSKPRPVPGTEGSRVKGAGTPALVSAGQVVRWLHCGLVMSRYVPGAARVRAPEQRVRVGVTQ